MKTQIMPQTGSGPNLERQRAKSSQIRPRLPNDGRISAKFGRFGPKLVELGPKLADVGQMLANLGKNWAEPVQVAEHKPDLANRPEFDQCWSDLPKFCPKMAKQLAEVGPIGPISLQNHTRQLQVCVGRHHA